MVNGKLLVEKLLKYAQEFLHLNPRDEIYFRNLLLREFKLDSPYRGEEDVEWVKTLSVPDVLVKEIEEYALENALAVEGLENLYSTYVMGLLSPLPSEVNRKFLEIKENEGVEKACEYFYNLSIMNNYVQKTAIGRNLKWDYPDGDKYLEITVNLSKPEKDNKEIAKLLTLKKSDEKYPECLLCKENEGYQGTATHPARENIRTISLCLGGEKWFVQYSPYAYYNEHMIAISEKHAPMHIKGDTVQKLLDFVDFFPNYMIGSNAALPIVGGSILNHEHFQGGEHLMPMHNSKIKTEYYSERYPSVRIGILDWYNSVIRLNSADRSALQSFATEIISAWEGYTDEQNGIYSNTNGVPHNSLSPVCRKIGDSYQIDLILRNNRTSEEFPDGIFHAHPEYHNIKKEGIGLIEAMGLFILPGRLKKQLNMIAEILCQKAPYNKEEISSPDNYLYAHRDMIKALVEEGFKDNLDDAMARVTLWVNEVCKNILYNTAVFKNDDCGALGFDRFMKKIGSNKR
ncbi:MAG: UDP-glucose--hexose-1-phosphate uridylyltransferase [Clostridiales bacterium]|nr:UDP-glucose--hexose-1-phosphate uridylyltransferase [Clostridiales bacterium]